MGTSFSKGARGFSNLARGLTPTVSGFSTNPAPLSEVTDEDEVAFTTAGIVAAGGTALITVDLGGVKFSSLSWYAVFGGNPSYTTTKKVQVSADGSTWTDLYSSSAAGNASNSGISRFLLIRYARAYHDVVTPTDCTISHFSISIIGK